jgi:hypothetical protein
MIPQDVKNFFEGPLKLFFYGVAAILLTELIIYLNLIDKLKDSSNIDINTIVIVFVALVLMALVAYLWLNRSVLDNALANAVAGPLRILLYGLVIFIVILLFTKTNIFSGLSLGLAPQVNLSSHLVVAVLVFFIGIAFAAFLWWLCRKYFELLDRSGANADQIAALKDMPMALPEGTVRAVIALVVGVVGLPILIFSSELHLSDAIAGYVNGIIIGVFSYYFGTRTGGADAQTAKQTVRMLDTAQSENKNLQNKVSALAQQVDVTKAEATSSRLQSETERLEQQVGAAQAILEELAPALPKGLIPDNVAGLLGKAKSVLSAAKALEKGGVNDDSLKQVADAAESLIGSSPITSLLQHASGILPVVGGVTPVASLALLLGVGWRLGSEQYQRWVARVLDAPYDPTLIDIGRVTPTSAQIALANSPIFSKAFPAAMQTPAFMTDLVDMALSNDAEQRLWAKFGNDASHFASEGELLAGLDEFRRLLLSDVSALDITDDSVAAAWKTLQPNAATPPPKAMDINEAIDKISVNAKGASDDQRSAFDALVMLTGYLREAKIDPAKIIAELKL